MVIFFKILLVLIIINFPLGQLTRLPLGTGEINLYFQDILIAFLVAGWLIWHIIKKLKFSWPVLTKPILLFFLIAGISLLVNSFYFSLPEIGVSALYLLRWIFYAGVYFALQEYFASGEDELKQEKHSPFEVSKKPHRSGWGECHFDTLHLRWGMILAGTATAIFGLLQYFLYPDLRNLVYLGWDPHKYRIFGTFLDPSFLGLILVLTIILTVNFFYRRIISKLPYSIILSTCYLALALTYSRGSYLAYLVGIGIIAWMKKSIRLFLAAFLIGVLTIWLLPRPPESEGVRLEREESIKARIKNWRETLIIFKDHPILGVGFDTYRYVQRNYGFISQEDWRQTHSGAGADSSLLFVLATTGILGFTSFCYIFYSALQNSRKNNAVVFSSFGAILVHSFFSNSQFYPWIMLWMWILLAQERKMPLKEST